jgi:hypothetical protein
MEIVTDNAPRALLHMHMEWVTRVLDSLPQTVPHRRAALLAAAGVAYKPEAPVTDYAPALMQMNSAELELLAEHAAFYAIDYPNQPEDPMPEEERLRYLAEIRLVARDVEVDEDLAPAERRHFRGLLAQLCSALEAAPQSGAQPVETAAKAIVGDIAVNRRLWKRIAPKAWAKKLVGTATALIMLVGAYSSGKEFVTDVAAWFGSLPAISVVQDADSIPTVDASDVGEDIHDAETLGDEEADRLARDRGPSDLDE